MHMCQQMKQAQLTPLPYKALGPLPFLVFFFFHVCVCVRRMNVNNDAWNEGRERTPLHS